MIEEKVWATPEYETKLLQEILSRVERELKIDNATPKEKEDIIRKELLECYNDPVYFIENYLYTDKNPRFFSKQIQTLVPFLLFDYQVETIDILLDAVNKGEKVFIEKSRQLGLSWLVCAFALWGWYFRDWKILFLSQKEDYVDKIGDMQSLFQKIRFMVLELPKRMLPPEFSVDEHMPRLRIFKPLKYGTGSIVGESANPNAGTGGTYKFVFMDEMAKMAHAGSINTSIQAATGCVIYNSTPVGKFNEYYRMRLLAIKKEIRYIRLHWSQSPLYTKEWYQWRITGMSPEQIAQELEISYDASVKGRVYPRFAPIPIGDCSFDPTHSYDPYLPLYCSIDNSHGGEDNHAIILAQTTSNGKIRVIDSLQLPSFTTIDECASLLALQPIGKLDDEAYAFFERYKTYKRPIFIADPYDSNSTWNDTSISKIYRNYGITLNVPERTKTITERIRNVTNCLGRLEIAVDTESPSSINWGFVSAIQNARYPERNENSQSTSENIKPVHDATSHFRTSFEYLINFIVESEESMGIVGGKRKPEREKELVEVPDYITGETKLIYK